MNKNIDKEEILKLRNDGGSYNEISKITGFSKSKISYYCSKLENNTSITKLNDKLNRDNEILNIENDEFIEIIKNLRENGKNFEEINIITKVPIFIISKISKKYDLIINKIGKENKEKIINLFKNNKSISYISKEIKVSRYTVSKYLDKLGLKKKKENKEKIENKNLIKNWRKKLKIKLVDYKGGKCTECGYNKCLAALEFHHIDPKEKDFSISSKGWSFDNLLKEVDKCILVCNRCHTEIHENLKTVHTEQH